MLSVVIPFYSFTKQCCVEFLGFKLGTALVMKVCRR